MWQRMPHKINHWRKINGRYVDDVESFEMHLDDTANAA